jgi:adenylate kinase
MIVALTGTPGTGKSDVARSLRAKGATVIALNELAFEKGFIGSYDRRRRTREVDIKKLGRCIDRLHPRKGLIFLEGHYSHLLPVGRAIVLRCAPKTLRKRLSRRGYPRQKIAENCLAEALDTVTIESVGRLGKARVLEIETTGKIADTVAATILRIGRAGFRRAKKYRPGRIDFSDDIIRNPNYYSRT